MKKIPLIFILCAAFFGVAFAQTESTQELADRYELMLLSSPQPGKAFDGVIEWYSTKGGGLEALQKRWEMAASEKPESKQGYLLAQGLLAERLRAPDAARNFYTEALSAGDPAQPARMLAILETTEGNFDAATKAYEQALASEALVPLDRMELMRSLALLYQRRFEDEKALAVWRDAMKRFPDDAYVLEEAAEAFLAAGKYDEARAGFTKLRELSGRDPFKKINASLRLARAAELEGKTDEAVGIYAQALDETSQGSWLNRDVRSRIEELFRRKNDLPGLLSFYEKRTAAQPQDFQSFAAMSEAQEELGRGNEALESLRKAAQLAPENQELQLRLVRKFEQQGRGEEALAAAKELAKSQAAPNEVLVMLGELQWKQFEKTKQEADKAAAVSTWRRIAPEKSTDIEKIARLAELLAAHDLTDEAMGEWKRMIALQPSASDARQRLAEVLVKRGEVEAGKAVLAGLIAEDRATPENFLTLARLQVRLEWPEESKATTSRGLELFPNDYELLSFAWRQVLEAQEKTAVEKLFPRVWKQAPNPFYAEESVKDYVAFLESAGTSKEFSLSLQKRLTENRSEALDAVVLFRLGIAQADESAAKVALQALQSQTDAVRVARAQADFAEVFEGAEEQVAALKAVALADPRLANESLRKAARILSQTGKTDEALKLLSELLERSPADGSLYSQYADVAVANGNYEEATRRLTEALRYVEDTTSVRLQLATLLQVQGRTNDASRMLQAAFEGEEREARRMEIFRRQIEMATLSGTIEDLMQSLREKQSREQGGARYGVYLAEILMMQGDNLGAKEELSRSLGRNPENASAVAKLMELADRGGDSAESIRLSARLVELDPSPENRAAYLTKLLDSGEEEAVETALEAARPEILKNPIPWTSVLSGLLRAGMLAQFEQLVSEISSSTEDPAILCAVAELRLQNRDYSGAERELWRLLEKGNLAEALEATNLPPQGLPGLWLPQFYGAGQGLQQMNQMVINDLRTSLASGSHRFGSFRVRSLGMPQANLQAAQKAELRGLFLLGQLAKAARGEEAFFQRLDTLLERQKVGLHHQVTLLSILGNPEGVRERIKRQAEASNPDPSVDRFLALGYASVQDESLIPDMEKILERVAEADPQVAFQRVLFKTISDLMPFGFWGGWKSNAEPSPSPESQRTTLEKLLSHPGRTGEPKLELQLASLAVGAEDLELALKILEECEQRAASGKSVGQLVQQQTLALRAQVVSAAIRADHPRAQELYEQWLKDAKALPKVGRMASYSYYGMVGAGSSLVQESRELSVGDAELPYTIFAPLFPSSPDQNGAEKVKKWFALRAETNGFDAYDVALFYLDWSNGKRDEAVKQLEALHAKAPSPRSAALLLEAYEKSKDAAKALEVIDLAEMQPSETSDIRALRRVRLLRLNGNLPEAKAAAEKLASTRVGSAVRQVLPGELSQLGISATKSPSLTRNLLHQPRAVLDMGQAIRGQVNKLVQEKKIDEAEAIALQELRKPLPRSGDDYQKTNTRSNLIQILKNIGRLEALEAGLRERLEKDPGDVDAGIRLLETSISGDHRIVRDQVFAMIRKHPERVVSLGYLLYLLQQSRGNAAEICALLSLEPEVLGANGVDLNQIITVGLSVEGGALLAEAVAELPEEKYQKLLVNSRLIGHFGQAPNLAALAEYLVSAGKVDGAIRILQRAAQEESSELSTSLRLAELQLAEGKKEDAVATMNSLVGETAKGGNLMVGPRNALTRSLANLAFNSQGNALRDQIAWLGEIAEATGTLELVLKKAEEASQYAPGVPPSLLIRTQLGKPGVEKEWREIATGNALQNMNAVSLMMAFKTLSNLKDGEALVASLLKKVPTMSLNHGSGSLGHLKEVVPALSKFSKNSEVRSHIQSVVSAALADPNAAQHLLHMQFFTEAVRSLIEHEFLEEAQRLMDATLQQRTSGNHWDTGAFEALEAQMELAKGNGTPEVVCAASPSASDRLKVYWSIGWRRGSWATWEEGGLPVPKARWPSQIEILCGPNPASLERVALVTPTSSSSGITEVKTTAPLGLLQARWKMRDGSTECGPLTAYVVGENLIVQDGVPPADEKPGGNRRYFRVGQPGPLGPESAVVYDRLSATPESSIPLLQIKLEDPPGRLVQIGWVQASSHPHNRPRFEMELTGERGSLNKETPQSPAKMGPGQWCQVTKVWNAQNINKEAKSMQLSLKFNASTSHNNQYAIQGSWAGLQLVKLPDEAPPTQPSARVVFQEALQKKNYPAACDLFLADLRSNPGETLSRNGREIFDAFKLADRSKELFTALAQPALYLPNPLRPNESLAQNSELITLLATEALAKDSPAIARTWLQLVQKANLPETARYSIDAILLQEAVARDPSALTAERILALLGWTEPKPKNDRLRRIWSTTNAGHPTFALLDLVAAQQKENELLELLKSRTTPPEFLAAQRMLEAWLTLPKDAAGAVELWRQSVALRKEGNASDIQTGADRRLLLKFAETDYPPGDLVASVRAWVALRDSNVLTQNQRLVELLFEASEVATTRKAQYLSLWADAELAALKTPGYNASRDRVRGLADRFYAAGDWDRLDALLALADQVPSLRDSAVREEFRAFRGKLTLARGDLSSAWPVSWVGRAADPSPAKVTLHWQWNMNEIDPRHGIYDTAVAVADEPIVKTIPNQTGIEFWFGEMPNSMQLLRKIEGDAAFGSVEVELPGKIGFLRAIALFADRTVPGPLVPILSGTRVLPVPGSSLKSMFLSGDAPVDARLLSDGSTAPDGSVAVKIGTAQEKNNLSYVGPVLPAKPGVFYVLRAWIRRAGNGSMDSCVEYRPTAASKKGTLSMILNERTDSPGRWVLYSRAIPALPEHTFWIPYEQVEGLLPRFWNLAPGTEIASWELFEIEGWKYGEWISELALLREKAKPPLTPEQLIRASELAAIEPLTSLDYHGSWLAEQMIKAGKGKELLELYRVALKAEANPLFSRPKMWRLYNAFFSLLDSPDCSRELKLEAVGVGLANKSRLSDGQALGLQRRWLMLAAGQEDEVQVKTKVAEEIRKTLNDPEKIGQFFAVGFNPLSYREDRPINECVRVLSLLEDEELLKQVLREFEGDPGKRVEISKRVFAKLAVETCLTGVPPQAEWEEKLTKAFGAASKSQLPDHLMYWPAVLGDLMIARKADPAAVLTLRTKAFEYVKLLVNPEKSDAVMKELIRAGEYLIEASLVQENRALAIQTAEVLIERIKGYPGKLSDDSLRMVLRSLDQLGESDGTTKALFEVVRPHVEKSEKVKEAYAKFFSEVSG